MTGKAEVERQQKKLDAVFKRAGDLGGNAELLSHYSRYLCVLVSGFLEQSVIELLTEYIRSHADSRVQRHFGKLKKSTNLNSERLLNIVGSFDPDWRKDIEAFLVDEYKDAVNGIVDLRNAIAHGRDVGITMARVTEYYDRVKVVVEHIGKICV